VKDDGNSVGLGDDNDDGDDDGNVSDDDNSKSAGVDVGVSASTIDVADDRDVTDFDFDGAPDRSKNDGMLEDVGLDDDDDDCSDGEEDIILAEYR
jgi:hypothetical protein